MEAVREITVWEESEYSVPNHTYLLNGDNMIAYIKQSGGEPFYFKTPIKFKRSGRKFVEVKPNPFDNWAGLLKGFVETAEPLPFIKKVQGSKPNTWYEVDTDAKTCTCSGYTFRGTCQHVKELETAE
jgi:hypothetical protein